MSHAQDQMGAVQIEQRPRRKTRACVPCHERKVRCNAFEAGLPCTRCVNSRRAEACILIPVQEKTGGKRKRVGGETTAPNSPNNTSQSHMSPADSATAIESSAFDNLAGASNPPPPHPPQLISPTQSPILTAPTAPCPVADNEGVREDETQLHMCREMSQWGSDASSPTRLGLMNQGREVIEYHGGTNCMTILSEVFAKAPPKRLVRIVLSNQNPNPGQPRELLGLDEADVEYLNRKGAFIVPSDKSLEKLLRLYFECVYPYAPIFDPVEFLNEYMNGTSSTFLMQAILASTVPYASHDLLRDCGFNDHHMAQKTFFNKAKLLCDIGVEKSQLRLLQGSTILSLLHFSFSMDSDYRYWLSNAVRLATKMGLHRADASKDLDDSTRKLFRRIWWVIYYRDALLVVNGLDNLRRLHDGDFDTPELTEADWNEEVIPFEFKHILPETTRVQKLFLIESCKLSRINNQFIESFSSPCLAPSETSYRKIEETVASWRRILPNELCATEVHEWSVSNVWILVLMARSYLFECILYRMVRETFRASSAVVTQRASQRLQGAIFELDTTMDRILLHNVSHLCPLFLMNCASTALALHIETALQPSTNTHKRQIARTRIHNGLAYLRSLSKSWSPVEWTLQMFEVIVSRTGLLMSVAHESEFNVQSDNPFNANHSNGRVLTTNGFNSRGVAEYPPTENMFQMPGLDSTFGPMNGINGDDWLYELLNTNFLGLENVTPSLS